MGHDGLRHGAGATVARTQQTFNHPRTGGGRHWYTILHSLRTCRSAHTTAPMTPMPRHQSPKTDGRTIVPAWGVRNGGQNQCAYPFAFGLCLARFDSFVDLSERSDRRTNGNTDMVPGTSPRSRTTPGPKEPEHGRVFMILPALVRRPSQLSLPGSCQDRGVV